MHQSCEPTFDCPSEECLMCNGEACSLCGAGYLPIEAICEHDVLERHADDLRREGVSR